MGESICRFSPPAAAPDVIHIHHFVYEAAMGGVQQQRLESAYKLALVATGTASLLCRGSKRTLQPGDLFFAFPATPYTLEGSEDFTYLYVSFLGLRANMLLDRLGIDFAHCVFSGFSDLLPLWMDAIRSGGTLPELAGESVLLYSLMKLGNTLQAEKDSHPEGAAQAMLQIRKYIDDRFADPELKLSTLAQAFSYHEKYLSCTFKKYFKVGIREYITDLRINHACGLMEQGYTCVKDIAALCGYTDPLYFSKLFRKAMHCSPRQYIKGEKPPGE